MREGGHSGEPSAPAGAGMPRPGAWPTMWQYDFLVRVAGSRGDAATLQALAQEVEESGAVDPDEKACLGLRIEGALRRLARSTPADA